MPRSTPSASAAQRTMKKLLLALILVLVGCPSNAPQQVDASDFDAGLAVDAAVAPHRVGSFNPTCSGTGIPHVVSGVQTSACAKVDTTSATDVIVPATVNGVITSTGGQLTQALNVLAGTNFLSIGSGASTTGTIRMANATDIRARDVGNTSDRVLITTDTSNELFIGTDSGFTTTQWGLLRLAATQLYVGTATNQDIFLTGSAIAVGFPIIGNTSMSSPYAVHGKVTDATAGAFTVASATYKYDIIQLTGATAATVTFPLPASDAAAYYKTLINTSGVTKTIAAGAAATTQPFNTGNTARFMFDSGGVHLAAASTAYP